MGTTLLTVAITTVSPWLRPETIWVRSESDAPMVTGTVCAWPLTSVCTVSPAPEGRIALLGTVSTAVTWLITSEIEADTPAWSEGLLPVSMTVTGKVATPELTVASGAMPVTLPWTCLLAPATVICAVWPRATSLIWASVTVPTTSNAPGSRTTIAWVLLVPEPDEAEPDPAPEPPWPPPEEDVDEVEALPPEIWPTVTFT